MNRLQCEFFASEDGEPFCAFAYGHVPLGDVESSDVRERIMREADIWDLEAATIEDVREAMQREPAHLWIRQDGPFEDSPFYFCSAEDERAIAITGWKLR